jgi:putative lipoic acid-binding regulatory protein
MTSEYDKRVEELAKLPRAERFEELIDFPAAHTFKVIGRTEGLIDALQQKLEQAGYSGVVPLERPSAQGRYLSLTFTLRVASGQELDALYTLLETLPGLAYLL